MVSVVFNGDAAASDPPVWGDRRGVGDASGSWGSKFAIYYSSLQSFMDENSDIKT
ncbi:hypothetical protein Cst04h_05360 [Corynebacterium striatum]|uniref:Uncharacterized protein n=1 Tax=Corynebacterium striatum TaxID=43770 RepID=A0ABC9ZKD5_CORST|nr:hypothetical protein Cst04h_05360 [Corynebacterium striatum]GKH15797.1 hypothetical protein CE91St29_01100 [Corynebacterium striatum]